MASSILRTFSAWRASGASRSSRLIFVTPSTRRATSGAKLLGDRFERNLGVFDHVVQQGRAKRRDIQLHVREDVRYFHGMGKVGLAGEARLRLVLLGGEIVGAAQEVEIVARTVAAHLVHQLDKAQIHRAAGRLRYGRFTSRFHIPLYSEGRPTASHSCARYRVGL